MYRHFFKPIIDFVIALTALLILSPLLIIVFLLLALANNGKPLFFQKRPGKDGKIFKIVKFRTMNDKRDKKGELLPDPERLTKTGKIVRKTSIDEIPQLWNVLRGNMSLIGPRPLLPEYLPLYDEFQQRRHEVKPGITGWAQVNGRNTITWDQKFKYDVWYVDNVSLKVDANIFYLTVKKVLSSADVSAKNHISMPKFSDQFNNK
ncbi:sugar transferase [Autumnicola edwardsiae]|uniref:Sugar transferase n=1 Tax=Autumnicola edwardsiae TaxID=3075594 RepID=A0ABU3CU21_9FLAO|nr:sugar transferase [Zunongwangia sp. F297]MDT0649781.1 sugar transferase [Zunongwangia sp. F297]